jgi:hypothetical protein
MTNPMWKRVSSGALGALAVLAGTVAFGYARMASDDFNNPNAHFLTAILGTGLMWLLTFGAFCMGIHLLKHCFSGKCFRVNRWARALILGTLSFFPGFIASAIPAAILVSKRWPTDIQAGNIAMLTSAFVGALSAIIVGVALIRTGHRSHRSPQDNC